MSKEIALRKRYMVESFQAGQRGDSFKSTDIADIVVGSGLFDRRPEAARQLLGDYAAAHALGKDGFLENGEEMDRVEQMLRRAGVDI